jgi:putative ABC transport system permease protein
MSSNTMPSNSMFGYYLSLALRSFKRNKALTALMVLAIALGIGASMTTLTVFHVLSGNPIPQKSGKLFYPRLDAASKRGYQPGEDPESQMTRFDAEALLREKRGDRQAVMTAGSVAIEPDRNGMAPFIADARFTTADFFPMFEAPLAYGRAWSSEDDQARARVAVISAELNEKLFGGGNSVGKTVRLEQTAFKIIGVLKPWRLKPKFYDLTQSRFGTEEQVFVPFWTSRALDMSPNGNMNCWGDTDDNDKEGSHGLNAKCAWLQYWVELDSPANAAAYLQYLKNYSDQQRAAGRFERPTNVRLDDVMGWMDEYGVVPPDVRLQSWLAFGFLFVCLVNTIGLLLAKFLRRSSEIGVRRALGATKRAIFVQYLVEAGVIGLAGGALGLCLALLGLWAVRQQPTDYAELAHLNSTMLLTAVGLSLVASLIAGLLPAWRACQVAPAIQLKSQ